MKLLHLTEEQAHALCVLVQRGWSDGDLADYLKIKSIQPYIDVVSALEPIMESICLVIQKAGDSSANPSSRDEH